MKKEPRNYANAGAQTAQALSEMNRYGALPDDALITLKTVSLILEINRNSVAQIPVPHTLIDKRKCYRKGDIAKWAVLDVQQPDSLLLRLREKQAVAVAKIARQPSRRYSNENLSKEDAAKARKKSQGNIGMEPSKDEMSGGWDRGLARRRNGPIPGAQGMNEKDADFCAQMSASVRKDLQFDDAQDD